MHFAGMAKYAPHYSGLVLPFYNDKKGYVNEVKIMRYIVRSIVYAFIEFLLGRQRNVQRKG